MSTELFGIGNYIVDFYCSALHLVIEIDGGTHDYSGQIVYDEKRQQYLESLGIKVIRFNSKEVLQDINNVLNQIDYLCKNY